MPCKDPAREKENKRKYYIKNRETIKERARIWNRNHKAINRRRARLHRLHHPWLNSYYDAKKKCENPNHSGYRNYGAKDIKFKITLAEIQMLWIRCGAKDMEHPVFDRRYYHRDFVFRNCVFVERDDWRERRRRIKEGSLK